MRDIAEAGEPPVANLGPGVEVTAFEPGRFASAIQKTSKSTHALQLVREDSTASFIVDLEPGGVATARRGWRYQLFNDGSRVHTMENLREQQGYRGQWTRQKHWVHLDLTADDGVCPPVREYSQVALPHSTEWHLRCLHVTPRSHSTLPAAALICQPRSALEPADEGTFFLPGILPKRWLVLGDGNGLRIRVDAKAPGDRAPRVHAEVSPERLREEVWQRSF